MSGEVLLINPAINPASQNKDINITFPIGLGVIARF